MKASFRASLPTEFVDITIALCGKAGENWLDTLPERTKTLEKRWSIKIGDHFPNLSYNFVAPASCADGAQAVLKIGLPLNNVEIFGEAKYLRTLDGDRAVRLLAEDRELQAILIERALPGINLTQVFAGREPESVQPSIEVLRHIIRPSPEHTVETISLDDWFDGLRRYPGTKFPAEYACKALVIYDSLSRQPGHIHYLHGDFHPDNILSSESSQFIVIDPKGIVGHIGYEISVFLNNFHWWQEQKTNIRETLDVVVRQFAKAFDLDPLELRQWAFAQMVLSAWWTFDEMPDIYDNEVAKADIWDV